MLNKLLQFILLILFIFFENAYSNAIENAIILSSTWTSGIHQEILAWPFAHVEPPDGWLECDGRMVDPIKYPKLYKTMETTPDYNDALFTFTAGNRNWKDNPWYYSYAGPHHNGFYFRNWQRIPWSQFPKRQSLWISNFHQYMDELDYYRYEPFYFYSNKMAINNMETLFQKDIKNRIIQEQGSSFYSQRFNADYTNFDNENLSDLLKNEKQYKIQNQVGNGGSFFSYNQDDFIVFNSWGSTKLGDRHTIPFHFSCYSCYQRWSELDKGIKPIDEGSNINADIKEYYNRHKKTSLMAQDNIPPVIKIIADYHSGSDYTLPKFVRVRYFIRAK